MTTLTEATYNVLNALRGGQSQNNEPFSIRQIAYTIGYYRALLIRRDFERKYRVNGLDQDLGLLAVEVVDPGSGTPGMSERGLLLRTSKAIPEPVRLSGRSGITAVTSGDFRFQFPIIDAHRARWLRFEAYTAHQGRAFLQDSHVYVHTSLLAEEVGKVLAGEQNASDIPSEAFTIHTPYVRVRGIFENPQEAYEIATGKEWDNDTTPYPLPKDMEQRIVQALLSGEFEVMRKTPNDQTSDMRSETDEGK